MKMSDYKYQTLKMDIATVAKHLVERGLSFRDIANTENEVMWLLLNVASSDRMNDDSHPGYATGVRTRILPFSGRDGCGRPIYNIYEPEGLKDHHIGTALRKIAKELKLFDNAENKS